MKISWKEYRRTETFMASQQDSGDYLCRDENEKEWTVEKELFEVAYELVKEPHMFPTVEELKIDDAKPSPVGHGNRKVSGPDTE